MKNGQIELAIKNFEKSLELNPDNENAREMLKKFKIIFVIAAKNLKKAYPKFIEYEEVKEVVKKVKKEPKEV